MVRRADLEEVIADLVDRAAAEGRRTIDARRVDRPALTAVYLTGGSSRVQLVSQRLAGALGLLPRLEGDLKAVVVLGALKAHAARPPAPAASPRPSCAARPSPDTSWASDAVASTGAFQALRSSRLSRPSSGCLT